MKLTWSETEVGFIYQYNSSDLTAVEVSTVKGQGTRSAKLLDLTASKFSSADDAVNYLQFKKKREFEDRWQIILKSLFLYEIKDLSVENLYSLEMQVMDEMDSRRQMDPITGELCECEEYVALEEMLWVLEEALNCIFQIQHLDNQTQLSAGKSDLDSCRQQGEVTMMKKQVRKRIRNLLAFTCLVPEINEEG